MGLYAKNWYTGIGMAAEENKIGLKVTSGHVTLQKDSQNLIGISIGGGAPYCPCLYVVQLFDNTPASIEGSLASGDEIVGVNGECVKGRTKVEVAKIIQNHKPHVTIMYNKLHADPKQGKTLDIVLKKVKHRFVENLSVQAADALGLSRAILVNDSLVKKFEELNSTATLFDQLSGYFEKFIQGIFNVSQIHRAFGEVFGQVGCYEPQPKASEVFREFSTSHKNIEKYAVDCLKQLKPILGDMGTFSKRVVPDMKLTIKRYLDCKFEYLSYCLKVKEMDDEEFSFNAMNEPLYRVETGNYEYRLILRCRQDAKTRFAKLRSDVLEKLELLDNKHVQDVVSQMQSFVQALNVYHAKSYDSLKHAQLFPIELDLSCTSFSSLDSNLPSAVMEPPYQPGMMMLPREEEDDSMLQLDSTLTLEEDNENGKGSSASNSRSDSDLLDLNEV